MRGSGSSWHPGRPHGAGGGGRHTSAPADVGRQGQMRPSGMPRRVPPLPPPPQMRPPMPMPMSMPIPMQFGRGKQPVGPGRAGRGCPSPGRGPAGGRGAIRRGHLGPPPPPPPPRAMVGMMPMGRGRGPPPNMMGSPRGPGGPVPNTSRRGAAGGNRPPPPPRFFLQQQHQRHQQVSPQRKADRSKMDLPRHKYDRSESGDDGKKPDQGKVRNQNLRKCASCDLMLSTDHFSKNQLKKREMGRCRPCAKIGGPGHRTADYEKEPKRPRNSIALYVNPIVTKKCMVYADLDGTIADVKQLIHDETGISPHFMTLQKLSTLSGALFSNKTIKACGLRDGEQLRLNFGPIRIRADLAKYVMRPKALIKRIKNHRERLGKGFEHYPFNTVQQSLRQLAGAYSCIFEFGEEDRHNFGRPILGSLFHIPTPGGRSLNDVVDNDKGSIKGTSFCFENESDEKKELVFLIEQVDGVSRKKEVRYRDDRKWETCTNCDLIGEAFEDESKYIALSIHKEESQSDDESSVNETDFDVVNKYKMMASLLVFDERFVLPRNDIIKEDPSEVMLASKGDELMAIYLSAPEKSWLCNHLHFPADVAKKIWSFWRTEPPPCLFAEKGDILFSLMYVDDYHRVDDFYAIIRKD